MLSAVEIPDVECDVRAQRSLWTSKLLLFTGFFESKFRSFGMTRAGRSSASARWATCAAGRRKCFSSANAIAAAPHALSMMNRETFCPSFSAPIRISCSSFAEGRKLIRCALTAGFFFRAVAMTYPQCMDVVLNHIHIDDVRRVLEWSAQGQIAHQLPNFECNLVAPSTLQRATGLHKVGFQPLCSGFWRQLRNRGTSGWAARPNTSSNMKTTLYS